MITTMILAAALWPQNLHEQCQPTTTTAIVGYAENAHGDFLYCELVSHITENKFHIDYSRDRKNFAYKDLTYSKDLSMPEVIQLDTRTGEKREAVFNNQKLLLSYQENRKKTFSTSTLHLTNTNVIDAGFDNYIRAHWAELLDGKTIGLNFASMSHQKILSLRVKSQNINKCTDKNQMIDKTDSCFVVEIDNVLLRFLLGNMRLTYDSHHRLKIFNGPVNIQDDSGNTQNAIIHYYYASDYSTN